jgi:excisionase family DNA binding protein
VITLDELRNRATITVPEMAKVLGIGRDQAYAAIKNGELPALPIGRTLRVPVPRLLALLGDVTPEDTEADPATGSATATVHTLTPARSGGPHRAPRHA